MVSNCNKIYPWYHPTCLSTSFKSILNLLLSLLSLVLRKTRVFLISNDSLYGDNGKTTTGVQPESLPPTENSFRQHGLRVFQQIYQREALMEITIGSIDTIDWVWWKVVLFWILLYLHVDLRTILTLNCCSLFETAFHSKLEMSQLIFTENQSTGFFMNFWTDFSCFC